MTVIIVFFLRGNDCRCFYSIKIRAAGHFARLFAPWMPCPTRPGAGCFTVCELTFFGMSNGAGQGRRSMCRPCPVGLASQIRGGGIPMGFCAPVPTSAAWLLGLPCPAAGLCQRCGGWALAHPSRPGPRPHPKGRTATQKDAAGAARGPKHNNARTGTKAHGSTAKGRANHPKPPTLAAPREGRQAQNRGAVERRTRGRAYPGGRVLGRLPRPPRDGHCRGAQGGRKAPP